jgi:Protein of unknown function DUF262
MGDSSMLPKPNTQALSWFYSEYEKGSLILTPKYQRNPIWSIGQKCFLIDSLISDCPIPQVFINIMTTGSGREKNTKYEVVDGQQRLRAILEFMNDEWPLIATTAKSYPVSDAYKPHINKKYTELPESLQDKIWNYPLAVQELRGWGAVQIRSLFRRLNYVVEKLNKQELRHSQYFGEFITAVEELAQEGFWDKVTFFTRRDAERMKDIEYVSELFVLLIEGVQDQQELLDDIYANYDVVFPKKRHFMKQFKDVLSSLDSISDYIKDSRFKKKTDFYGLFGATYKTYNAVKEVIDLSVCVPYLKRLSVELDKEPENMKEYASRYYNTVIEGANKGPKREERIGILNEIIVKSLE